MADNEFGTDLDPNKNFSLSSFAKGPSFAKGTLAEAMADGKSPEQTASDVKLSRTMGVSPDYVATMQPYERANEELNTVNWEDIATNTPVLYRQLEDKVFASLVKDDISNVGLVEKLWWKMAPEPGEQGGTWQSIWNAFIKGGYGAPNSLPIFGNERLLRDARGEYEGILDSEKALAEGRPISEIFGSAEDPSGQGAYSYFLATKEKRKAELDLVLENASAAMAWANSMVGMYPSSEATEKMLNASDYAEAADAFLSAPGTIVAEVGVENLVRQLPQLVGLAVGSALGGALGAGAASGVSSYTMERDARQASSMADFGLDPTKAEDVLRWYKPGEFDAGYKSVMKKNESAAAAVAMLDTVAGTVAATGLLPKGFIKSTRLHNTAEVLSQATVQGALGASGEALAQYTESGRITKWGDVFAEFAGEFATAPVDVASAAVGRRMVTAEEKARAEAFMAQIANLERAARVTKLATRDLKSFCDFILAIQKEAPTGKFDIDVQAVHEKGQDEIITGASEDLSKRFNEALTSGSDMEVTADELLGALAQRDQGNLLSEVVHPEGLPTFVNLQEEEKQIAREASARMADTLRGKSADFIRSTVSVGEKIGTMLSEGLHPEDGRMEKGNVTASMATQFQAYYQMLFATLAEDMSVMPEELFDKYGPRILFNAEDVEYVDGKTVAKSERAKKYFAANPEALNQGPHGAWLPGMRAIAQFSNSNASTFIHETGHMYLDMRTAIAGDLAKKRASGVELTAGEKHALEAVEAVMKWLGTNIDSYNKMDFKAKENLQEKFARSYEAYLFEGNAPLKSLVTAFRTFSAWLKSVYTALTAIPGAEINDNVREMFDNLFVAATQVELAKQRRGLYRESNRAAWADAAGDVGVTMDSLRRESDREATEELFVRLNRLSKTMTNIRERNIDKLSVEARNRLNQLLDEELAKLTQTRQYKAFMFIREGSKAPKITEEEIESLGLTIKQIELLKKLKLVGTSENGTGAMVAQKFGYQSVGEMVRELISMGDPQKFVQDAATARMLQEYADLSSPRSIAQAAERAIANDYRLRILRLEMLAYHKALGSENAQLKAIEKEAEEEAGRMPIFGTDFATRKYLSQATWARRRYERYRERGQVQQAIVQKRAELLNTTVVALANEAKKRSETMLKFFKRFKGKSEIKQIPTSYLIAIQHALDKVDTLRFPFPQTGGTQRTEMEGLKGFIEKHNAKAEQEDSDVVPIQITDEELDFVKRVDAGTVRLQDMTIKEAGMFYGILKEIYAIGWNEKAVEINGEKLELEGATNSLAGAMVDQAKSRGRDMLDNRSKNSKATWFKDLMARVGYSHFRIPQLFYVMEGKPDGYFAKYITYQANTCGALENELKQSYAKALDEIFRPIYGQLNKEKYRIAGLNAEFTKEEIFVMALNLGNEGNKQRLLDNSTGWKFIKDRGEKRLTETEVKTLISKALTAEDIQRVQRVWDLFEKLRKLVDAKEVRMHGRSPEWVEAKPVVLYSKTGKPVTLRGGYYPIVYDSQVSARVGQREEANSLKEMLKAANGAVATSKAHLKSRAGRVDSGHPLILLLSGGLNGFDAEIHDLCWDEWTVRTRRLFGEKVQQTMQNYYGLHAVSAVKKWIRDIATGKTGQTEMFDIIADAMRKNISLTGIGFNLVTAAIQPVGITQSVVAIGGKWVMSGLSSFATMGPAGAYRFCAERSLMMQDRARTQFREMAEIAQYARGTVSRVYTGIARAAYLPVMYSQMLVDIPTWIGAYKKALSEAKTEQEARDYADSMLVMAQGSGRMQDLSGVERGGAWSKLFTVFYTFFNSTYNLLRIVGQTQSGVRRAVNLIFLMVAQPVIETMIRESLKVGGDDSDDEEKYWEMLKKMGINTASFNLGYFVGLRELSNLPQALAGDYNMGYSGTAGDRKIGDLYKLIARTGKAYEKWAEKDEIDIKYARLFLTVFAEWGVFPFPVVPINRALSGHEAVTKGKAEGLAPYLLGYSDY